MPSYLTGTILFAVGSLFFLSTFGLLKAGAWCFIVGSPVMPRGNSAPARDLMAPPSKSATTRRR